jgi:siroheme synthase
MAIVVALTSAVALSAWPGATLTLRTIARIAVLYLGNARG